LCKIEIQNLFLKKTFESEGENEEKDASLKNTQFNNAMRSGNETSQCPWW